MTLSESTTFENQLKQYQQLLAALYRRESGSNLTAVPSEGSISNLNLTGYPLIAAEKLTVLSKGQTESDSSLSESEATATADAPRSLARLTREKEQIMCFHDIGLHNACAIDSLSITGPAKRGVVITSDKNESGKTTTAKAIHAALTTKWKFKSSEALSLSGYSSQEKPQVKLRLELDGYEFTLDKTFDSARDTNTIVIIHSPSAEVLKDDQAEEWLAARIHNADTRDLWRVFVTEQGQAQKTLSLGGYTQATNILQSASGQHTGTAREVDLSEAVKAEYDNYSQKNDEEYRQLINVDKELTEAQQVCDETAKKVREFEALSEEVARNEESQHTQRTSSPGAKSEVGHWGQALEELEEFRVTVPQAQEASTATKQQLDLVKQAQQERETFIQQAQDAKDQYSVAEKKVAESKEASSREITALKKAQENCDAVAAVYREARKVEELVTAEVALGERCGLVGALSK